MWNRKIDWQARKIITMIQEKNCLRSKKEKSSTSNILKSLVDAPGSTRTIRTYLNNNKIKHQKRIHRPKLTMKHKNNRLEYVHQCQNMNVKEWRKVVFSDEKKFNLDGASCFQKNWHAKNFPEENYSTRHREEGSLTILSSRKLNEERRLWRRMDFSAR